MKPTVIKQPFRTQRTIIGFAAIFVFSLGSLPTGGDSPPVRPYLSTVEVTVDTAAPGSNINPDMWGIFFEDINFGADGGLHAELVKNRSFEFTEPRMGWRSPGSSGVPLEIRTDNPLNPSNPHYARLTAEGSTAVENEGFRGMGVRKGESYQFRTFARRVAGAAAPKALRIELISAAGPTIGTAKVSGFGDRWALSTVRFKSSATDPNARMRIIAEGAGKLDLDMVSLYPVNTWKRRPMGLRSDLVQRLADLRPGFVRFPGGCIVEGRYITTRYQWKKTIGRHEERESLINRWNNEFRHRPAPDYFQTFGLGFMEYFRLCEDIGAEPMPILNCGMACQFNSKELVPLDRLEPYVQDALDLIEFANGPATSVWGAKRAALGHPKPFNMKYLGVGNEQWGPEYFPRYERFAKAIKAKYPDIRIISSAGPGPAGADFELAWKTLRALGPDFVDIVDEHVYAAPSWFLDNARRYDRYDRSGPAVFMGEYAAQSVGIARPDNRNNWECALSEAAFMTGLERNADVVTLSSYAPLFGHVEAWQWTPNLIWFDNLRSYATPNYHVQQLFMRNRGDRLLQTSVRTSSTESAKERFYASATLDGARHEAIVKLVNANNWPVKARVQFGERLASGTAEAIELTGDLGAVNSMEAPERIAPRRERMPVGPGYLQRTVPAHSLTVLRVPLTR